MSRASLEKAIPAGTRLCLDTSALIAYLGAPEPTTPVAKHILDEWVKLGRNSAVVAMVTVMELLVRPLETGPGADYYHIVDFLQRFPNLRAQPIDLAIAQEAASLRAEHKFKPPDALNIGTGIITQVGVLVTNDDNWKKKLISIRSRIAVCYLEDHLPFS